MLWWWLIGLAAASPALDAVARGDRAWGAGYPRLARQAWRQAVRLADDSDQGRAAEAMARVRRMAAGTNGAMITQGPALNAALEACQRGPWCRLAWADYHLLAPEVVGVDRARGALLARSVRGELPEAKARLDGTLPRPQPSLLALGALTGPASGLGLGLHAVVPQRGWGSLHLDGLVAEHAFGLSGSVEGAANMAGWVSGRVVSERWFDGRVWRRNQAILGRPGLRLRAGPWTMVAGPEIRWDTEGDVLVAGHGLWNMLAWTGRRARLQLEGDWAHPLVSDYERLGGVASLVSTRPLGRGELAGRLRGEAMVGERVPVVRIPTVGGPQVHRGGLPGELRGPWTLGVDLEARHPLLADWMWGAVFGDLVEVAGQGLHPGGGAGIRLRQPPRPANTLRLDLALTDTSWATYLAWGEAF